MHQRFAINKENMEIKINLDKCAFCDKKFTSKRSKCGRCKKVAYCDKNCQTNHWKTHKMVCKK